MQVIDIPISDVFAALWNANEMDPEMTSRLRLSVQRYGLLVRQLADASFETIGGAQRLAVIRELGYSTVPCVVTDADDSEARLLSQALNHIAGQDNLGLRGEVLRRILESIPEKEVAELLPGSLERFKDLTRIGKEDLAEYLHTRIQTHEARLEHLVFQLTAEQLSTVRSALGRAAGHQEDKKQNPNRRGNALAVICEKYLEEDPHDELTK